MGRDHTLFAQEAGFVKSYRDPLRHPKRQYIGVVFERDQTLPTPLHAATRRRLNMVTTPRRDLAAELEEREEKARASGRISGRARDGTELKMRPDYSFRE